MDDMEGWTHQQWRDWLLQMTDVYTGNVTLSAATLRRLLTMAFKPNLASVGMSIDEAERRLIEATLIATDNDKPRACEILGISVKTIYNKIGRYKTWDELARAGVTGLTADEREEMQEHDRQLRHRQAEINKTQGPLNPRDVAILGGDPSL